MRGINDYSFLFNNSSTKNTLEGSFNFADLAAIKNGTYKKLAQKHFSSVGSDDKSTISKNNVTSLDFSTKTGEKVRASVDVLKKSINSLDDKDLWKQTNGEYDTSKITKAIKKFATDYNDVIDKVADSDSKNVTSSARWITSLTNTMKTSLEKVGVKVGDDNKLTVDEDILSKADMKAAKAMFSGSYSYASQIEEKAASVSSAALMDSSLYNNVGSYSNTLSSWFNTSV